MYVYNAVHMYTAVQNKVYKQMQFLLMIFLFDYSITKRLEENVGHFWNREE